MTTTTTTTTANPNGQISAGAQLAAPRILGFGGPVALAGQMERKLVDERQWLTKQQMREAITICQSLFRLNEVGAISTHRWRST